MKKLLIICGPTATGKTDSGINLGKIFKGQIISADSRQVYKEMNIGTGKDLPEDAKFTKWKNEIGFYIVNGIKIWGYDLADPKQEFNVSDYTKAFNMIIKKIYKEGDLPILVGGTGLYIKSVTQGFETINVPPNRKLRSSLVSKTVDELYEMLSRINPIRSASMNISDKKNPRRLIRSIEVGLFKGKNQKKKTDFDVLKIGLTGSRESLKSLINKRVKNRIKDGLKNEITKLLNLGVAWDYQSMTSIGYKEWKDFFEGQKSEKDVIDQWIIDEQNYAKRQMTWFNKDTEINWFDVTKPDWEKNMVRRAKKWYYRERNGQKG